MRWANKGHEFDDMAKVLIGKKFYIYGCGHIGKEMYRKLKKTGCVKAFIDNNLYESCPVYDNIPVYENMYALPKAIRDGDGVIVSVGYPYTEEILQECMTAGLHKDDNLFTYGEFDQNLLEILYAYAYDKIYIKELSLSVTDRCTLKCKDCALLFPYLQNKKHRTLEDIYCDVELLFQKVDYIDLFEVIGGEPFMYPSLIEVLKYLKTRFQEKIGRLVVTTNATIIPPEKTLQQMKELDVHIIISDYSKIEHLRDNTEKLRTALEKCGVKYEINNQLTWVDFGLNKKDINKNEDEARETMETCGIQCMTVHNCKLYYCFPAFMAGRIYYNGERQEGNVVDLRKMDLSKKEFMEWLLGYSELGYLEMCRHCEGQYNNKNVVIPGIQLKN